MDEQEPRPGIQALIAPRAAATELRNLLSGLLANKPDGDEPGVRLRRKGA